MEISKNKTQLSDKRHLKVDIYKKLNFSPKKWENPKIMRFLSITLFRNFFHKSTYDFRNPHKIRDFLYPWSKICLTLLRGLCHFFEDKNRHYYANSQNTEKCLFYFVLRILTLIQSYNPLSWILKKVKIWPTLLYSVQCTLGCSDVGICTLLT